MDRHDKINAIMAAVAAGMLVCFFLYFIQFSANPKLSACLGIICLAIASFILGYVNGGR